jgi:hypothetical protein
LGQVIVTTSCCINLRIALQGAQIKVKQVEMLVITILLAVAAVFPSTIVAAEEPGSLKASAFVASVCSIDNTSLNFAQKLADEFKSANRVSANNVELAGLIPLSVTCRDSARNGTYLTSLATAKNANNSPDKAYTKPANQVTVIIYY